MLTKILYKLLSINRVYAETTGLESVNPLGPGGKDIPTLVNSIASALAFKIGPLIATFMFLYGAFQILTAGGNPEKLIVGKKTIIYTAVGYAIILISFGITSIIKDILSGG